MKKLILLSSFFIFLAGCKEESGCVVDGTGRFTLINSSGSAIEYYIYKDGTVEMASGTLQNGKARFFDLPDGNYEFNGFIDFTGGTQTYSGDFFLPQCGAYQATIQ